MFLIEFQIKYVTISCLVLTLFPVDCRISAYKNKGNTRFSCCFTISKTSSRSTFVRLLLDINYRTAMRSFWALFTLFFFLIFNAAWSQAQITAEFSAGSSEATPAHTDGPTDISTVPSGTDHSTDDTSTRFAATAQPSVTTETVTALPGATDETSVDRSTEATVTRFAATAQPSVTTESVTALPGVTSGTDATQAPTSGFTNRVTMTTTTTTTTTKATSKGSTMDTLSKTNIFQWLFVISMSLFLFL